jgi:hypothetical protein
VVAVGLAFTVMVEPVALENVKNSLFNAFDSASNTLIVSPDAAKAEAPDTEPFHIQAERVEFHIVVSSTLMSKLYAFVNVNNLFVASNVVVTELPVPKIIFIVLIYYFIITKETILNASTI